MKSPIHKLLGLAIVFAAVSLAGCSTISVQYDYDNTVDFMQYKTFGWVAPPDQATRSSAQAAKANSGLLDKRIRTAITQEMTARGMTEDAANPDLLVVFHLGSKDKIQVTDWGYHYSNYYWGGRNQIDVYQYTEGQLIIDMVDAASKDLVWRGSGTKAVNTTKQTPEQMQESINQAVNQIMASFPPKGK